MERWGAEQHRTEEGNGCFSSFLQGMGRWGSVIHDGSVICPSGGEDERALSHCEAAAEV